MAFICLRIPPLLFMPPRSSAAPSLAPLAFSASLEASGGPLPSRLCLLRTCASPAWLSSPPRFRPLSDGPPTPLASAGPPAATHSSAGPRVPFVAPEPRPMWVSAWASAGSSSELECSAVRLAAIPYRVSPGFSSINAGMYVRAAALHCRSPPLSAVLPSEGGRCAVTDAPLPRRPRLCPSWRRLRPSPRCYYDRSLCFLLVRLFSIPA